MSNYPDDVSGTEPYFYLPDEPPSLDDPADLPDREEDAADEIERLGMVIVKAIEEEE